jgi:hypothetical protein
MPPKRRNGAAAAAQAPRASRRTVGRAPSAESESAESDDEEGVRLGDANMRSANIVAMYTRVVAASTGVQVARYRPADLRRVVRVHNGEARRVGDDPLGQVIVRGVNRVLSPKGTRTVVVGSGEVDIDAWTSVEAMCHTPVRLAPKDASVFLAYDVRDRGEVVGLEFGGDAQPLRLVHVNRHDGDLEWCDREREDDAALVVVLLDGRRHDAGNANAIAAHDHRDRAAFFVQHGGLHGFAVFGAELEDMTHFDTALEFQRAAPVGAGLAGHHVAQVGDDRFRQIAAPVHAKQVRAGLVRAADEICHSGSGEHVDRNPSS